MANKMNWIRIVVVIAFIISLYLVEAGPWGSEHIALCNEGYGTFDMKIYDAKVVYSILPKFSTEDISFVNKYYICDYVFIFCFFTLQYVISQVTYKNVKSQIPRQIFLAVAMIRGVADMIENAILLYIINSYPNQLKMLVSIASAVTQIKLRMIPLWAALLVIGVICNHLKFETKIKKEN